MKRGFLALSLILASGTALAHEGHNAATGFLSGMLHPLSGMDHLFVILAFGMMAGLWAGKRAGGLIAGFISLFAFSALAGGMSTGFAGSEFLLMSTVIAAFALLAVRPLRGKPALILLFGLMTASTHGYVHGLELATTTQSLDWLTGAALSVVVLLIVSVYTVRILGRLRKEVVEN